MPIKLISLHLALSIIFFYGISDAATSLEDQMRALDMVANFADRMCERIPLEGSGTSVELTGEGKTELKGMLKKVASLGIDGAAKYEETEWTNVLQKDLAKKLQESDSCRLEVLKELKDKIIQIQHNKKVKKMFLEGETPDAPIPITDGVPIIGATDITQFRYTGKMFPNQKCLVSSGTEVKILQKEPKTVTATILGVPVNFGDFLTVTKVQIIDGPHKGTIGWAPTNLLRERIVEQTD
jgi:hypothetical protein